MPIKGISEIVRLPRLGKIRLGTREEMDDGSVYPVPTDHFICPDEVKKVFGEKPKELRIMFPTEDSEQWASQHLRCYSETGNLLCRGNGETALAKVQTLVGESGSAGETTSKLMEIPCSPFRCPCYKQGYCCRVMNLQFLLPDCPGFGVYQLNTSSFHSRSKINSFLELMRGTCQRLSMIPLWLKLVEQDVQPEGIDKIAYVLNLASPYSLPEIQRFAQIPPGQALILPPPDSEPPADLFPGKPFKASEIGQRPAGPDDKLLNLWARIKNKLWHFEIQDSQIASWFDKNYHIEVKLTDFDPPRPPAKLTTEMLSVFYQSIDRYAGR